MCRISGILNYRLPAELLAASVQKMCDVQQHGGPDDAGIWADPDKGVCLGHRRLSLLDLTSSGHQPMEFNDRYVISYNGEVYNFLALRTQLRALGKQFHTQTDTEVILAAYDEWGTGAFAKFEGMFAFALWDKVKSKLLLVRDPSGIKPLYYYRKNGQFAFASETKAFQFVQGAYEQNTNWPVYMLAYGHLPEPVTTLQNVQALPKGFFISYEVQADKCSEQSYAFFTFSENEENAATAKDTVSQLLRRAVRDQLVADAPLGVFLSGGIDSGILFLLAAEQKKQRLNSLSLYFDEHRYSEKKYQDILLDEVACPRNQYLLKGADFLDAFPSILAAMDQPSCDGINTWFISRYAKQQGLKAVLSGIGADELFGGYPSFKRMHWAITLQRFPTSLIPKNRGGNRKLNRVSYLRLEGISGLYLFLRGQFTPNEIARQLDADEKEVWQLLEAKPVLPSLTNLHPGNQASWMETNLYMQNQLLRDADVMSMAHGIEIRVPFLDHALQRYCLALPARIKFGARQPKSLLIDAFKKELPAAIWQRPKMGFSFPFKEWFSSSSDIKEQLLESGELGQNNYEKFTNGQLHWSQLLSLMLVNNKVFA